MRFDRLSAEKQATLRALLRGDGGVLLDERLGECSTRLAPADEKDKAKARRFEMTANTGKRIFRGWGDMVIDLAGIERPERLPMLLEHDDKCPVAVSDDGGLEDGVFKLRGTMLQNAENAEARKLIANMDEGVPYKASVGIRFTEVSEVEGDAEVEVNGEKHRGPVTVVRRCRLFETSFLLNPADLDTEAALLAAQAVPPKPPERKKPMADLSDIAPETMALIEAKVAQSMEAKRLAAEADKVRAEQARKDALTVAFPKRPKFVARMVAEGKTVDQAKFAHLEEKVAREKKKMAELRESARYAGGFVPADAPTAGTASGPVETRAAIEVGHDGRLLAIFEGFRDDKGAELGAAKAYALALEQMRRGPSRRFRQDPANDRWMVQHLRDNVRGPNGEERFGPGAKGAPDYALITVNGFKGAFRQAFERDINSLWSRQVAFISESDQLTETHRWLGQMPAMADFKNERQTTPMPIFSATYTAVLRQLATKFDETDYRLQKFGLLSQQMGSAGSIAAEDWDGLATTTLEANPTLPDYDNTNLYASNHNLGGLAPTAQQNDFTKADNGAFNPADPNNPSVQECIGIIMGLIQPMYGFKFNNGLPANGSMRQVVVVVPTNMLGNMTAALGVDKLYYGQSNPLPQQPYSVKVMINPRASSTKSNVVYAFRIDCVNKGLVIQEPLGLDTLFQGPGSYLQWFEHAFGFAVQGHRVVGAGDWLSTTRATLG